jgi:hypothetical protein
MKAEAQLASAVLMIRPVRFESNPQTAASNRFQAAPPLAVAQQQREALREFDGLADALRAAGVEVCVFEDTPEPHTPDAIFPNNWVSFHADGRVVLYPMEARNRREERRLDVIEALDRDYAFDVREVVDLTYHEQAGHFLEGTGSLVLDRVNRIAYACLSSRTHLEPLADFAQRLDYEVVAFDAVDRDGIPIYHTNVLMAVGEELALICDEAIVRDEQRSAVLARLRGSGHDVVSLSRAQLEAFAGNMLELDAGGRRLVAMSETAHASLGEADRRRIEANGGIVRAPISTIEASAGGSVRCMLAEIHLPRKGNARMGNEV